jgi:sugar-specific transcriptional regulator TrmB
MSEFQANLADLGLTKTQANVLGYLLEFGQSKASVIGQNIKQPRGAVYKDLEELSGLELVEKMEKEGQIARFRASHPRKIEKVLDKKERDLSQNRQMFEELLPQLVSRYNLTINKPGVIFYEGEDGLRKILQNTLSSQTEVYLFINTDAFSQNQKFQEINEEYKIKREKAGIKKKILRAGIKPENTFGQKQDSLEYKELTEIRYTGKPTSPFSSTIQIYDGKISYQTIKETGITSILIEDRDIYEMHKAFFELIWNASEKN